jgi:hypothetical protein
LCVEMVVSVASAGVEGLQDTNHAVLYFALKTCSQSGHRSTQGYEACKCRGARG